MSVIAVDLAVPPGQGEIAMLELLWLSAAAYLILQIVVILRSSGPSRWIAALPLLVMIPVFVWTIVGFVQESNLWPLALLFASPVALLYVVAAFVVQLAIRSRREGLRE
jgi:hypothetical protein